MKPVALYGPFNQFGNLKKKRKKKNGEKELFLN